MVIFEMSASCDYLIFTYFHERKSFKQFEQILMTQNQQHPDIILLPQPSDIQRVVHTISKKQWLEEQLSIEAALLRGGYDATHHIDLSIPAMEAIEGRLYDFAAANGVQIYDLVLVPNKESDLEATVIFTDASNAMLFKMVLP